MDTISVLLIEPNTTFLRVIVSLLGAYYSEYVTIVATSAGGSDALRKAQNPGLHIIVLSTGHAVLSDLQIIPHLHRVAPRVGIIVLGSLDLPAYQQMALRSGADAFVSKVNLNNALLPAMQHYMANRYIERYSVETAECTMENTGVYGDTQIIQGGCYEDDTGSP
jgi:DNA-binding NarL/FixJ family response regulator